ncbi:MAG TPA: response regulator [Polyangiaceae bacterium]|nr:response regulator [Polyangiaceae bacterium]
MTRLLFVDDDHRLLRALAQSLRSQRCWELKFAESAAAALEILQSWSCDAVVSDMRMPGLDGAELLKRVRTLQPAALRIVLSGQMDDAAAARSAALAHRFLSKPIETEALIAILKRSLQLREQFQSDSMRHCLGSMVALPSLPQTCVALNHALRDDNAPMRDVIAIIEGDVAMAAKVLQLVNSSFFGLPRHVISVEQAIRYLGLNAIRSLVLANALFEQLAGDDVTRLEAEQACALLLGRLTKRFPLSPRQAEIAGTAALLQNVGQLALISRLPKAYQKNHDYAREHAVSLDEAERACLGVTHAEIGAYLLSLWGLPFEVIEAVGSQDEPADALCTLDATVVLWLVKGLLAESLDEDPQPNRRLDQVALRCGVAGVVEAIRHDLAIERFARMAS